MNLSPTFRSAFLAGLAAPTGLYAAPAPYLAYVQSYSVAGSFGVAGSYLTAIASQDAVGREPQQTSFVFG